MRGQKCAPHRLQPQGAHQRRTHDAFNTDYTSQRRRDIAVNVAAWIITVLAFFMSALILYGIIELPVWLYGHIIRGWW